MPTWKQLKNDDSHWQTLRLKQKIISSIRLFFEKKGFLEMYTPLLLPAVIPESYLENFSTVQYDRRRNPKKMFLAASPEASLKKLLAAGAPDCFELTKSFRNTETGNNTHNCEFTILEWYRLKADYLNIINDCEELVYYINSQARGTNSDKKNVLTYQNRMIDLSAPWPRISVPAALEKYAGISFDEITDKSSIKNQFPAGKISAIAEKKGYKTAPDNSWEELFNQIYLNEIEPRLSEGNRPLVIYDFPAPMAALAKLKKNDSRLAQRFEFYIGNLELGVCYTELTDYREQEKRFRQSEEEMKKSKKNHVTADRDFLDALKVGLPDCAGIAVGVERLIMLFADKTNIQDTLFIV